MKITKLGFTNCFLQWLFIRLTKHYDSNTMKFRYYSIKYWILPLTGWRSNFIYVGEKPKFLKL